MKTKFAQTVLIFCILLGYTNSLQAQTAEIEKIQRDLRKIKDSTSYIDKLNHLAVLMYMKNPDSCFFYAVKAKQIAVRQHYTKGEADAIHALGIALSLKGLHHDALKQHNKALSSYKRLNDIPSVAMTYMNLASTHRYLSDSISAVRFLRKGIKEALKKPNDSIMAGVYINYCDLAPALPDDSSRYYLKKATAIAKHFKDYRVLLFNRLMEVTLLLNTPRQAEALPILEKALADSEAAGLEYFQITIYDLLAKYYADQPSKATAYYEKVLKILDKGGYVNLKPLVLMRMMPYAEKEGDKDKLVFLAKELSNAVSAKQERLSIFFSDYVRYNELEEANNLLEVTSKAEKKREIILISFSAGALLFLLVIFFLYRKSQRESRQKSELNNIIVQKNNELEANDAFKNKLVSILAHDFRSPLISTVSVVEILKSNGGLSPEEMELFYNQIQSDIYNMLDRFDSTLQWIRQQLQNKEIQSIDLSPKILIDEATAVFVTELQHKNITIENHIPNDLKIASDKEMLQFVNRNLISNAIKFSPQNGHIEIRSEVNDNMVAFSVSDNGKGLDAKTLESLFSINSTGSTRNGAGIALSMCRDFIEKLGGTIRAENRENGAIFYYNLPHKN